MEERSCYTCRLLFICKYYAEISEALTHLPKHYNAIKPLCTTVINATGQHCKHYEKENDK